MQPAAEPDAVAGPAETTVVERTPSSEITFAHAVKVGVSLAALTMLTAAAVGSVLDYRRRRKVEAMEVMWQEQADAQEAWDHATDSTDADQPHPTP